MFVLIRALFLLVFWVGLYFLPTIIAFRRQASAAPGTLPPMKIFLVNLFFGWTIYGWFVALQMGRSELTVPQVGHRELLQLPGARATAECARIRPPGQLWRLPEQRQDPVHELRGGGPGPVLACATA
jgi:hypothetical protein